MMRAQKYCLKLSSSLKRKKQGNKSIRLPGLSFERPRRSDGVAGDERGRWVPGPHMLPETPNLLAGAVLAGASS
eukprot:scaffold6051_cov14-Tisochrysis_lutea.AAC.2